MKITASPVNLDKILIRKNRIHRIGIELEGGWTQMPKGANIIRDGSVAFAVPPAGDRERVLYAAINNGMNVPGLTPAQRDAEYSRLYNERMSQVPPYVGEYPSIALEMDQWIPWIKQSYPQKVNATCGMHVHMSFASGGKKRSRINDMMIYQRLMDERLSSTIIEEFKKWTRDQLPLDHHIYARLEGDSEYCQHLYHADDQARKTRKEYEHHAPGHRYTVLNYCWEMHQTIECRLLPMMPSVEIAISAIQRLMDVVNAYLLATKEKEKSLIIDVPMTDKGYYDEVNLYI